MMYYAFISPLSRKAKAARSAYEYFRSRSKSPLEPTEYPTELPFECSEGVHVQAPDRQRILNLRLQDEHYSPYFRSDMSLFHILMMDDSTEMMMFRADNGWLITLEGIQSQPQPFGNQGHDMR